MQYQVIQSLKTKNKTLAVFDSFTEAAACIKENYNGAFVELSYMGGFPTFSAIVNKKPVTLSIQGKTGAGFVCSIPKEILAPVLNA